MKRSDPRFQRRVEEPDERHDRFEASNHLRIEAVLERELRLELAEREELLVLQVIGGRMRLVVSTRHARQTIAVELSEHAPERRRRHLPAEAWGRRGGAFSRPP